MIRAVFDMNVVVSGFLSPAGPPGRIVEWSGNGEVQAVVDDRIMAEYAEVLARVLVRYHSTCR
jgi:predicted nucleic acid-binding protein